MTLNERKTDLPMKNWIVSNSQKLGKTRWYIIFDQPSRRIRFSSQNFSDSMSLLTLRIFIQPLMPTVAVIFYFINDECQGTQDTTIRSDDRDIILLISFLFLKVLIVFDANYGWWILCKKKEGSHMTHVCYVFVFTEAWTWIWSYDAPYVHYIT